MIFKTIFVAAILAVSTLAAKAATFNIGSLPIAPALYSNVVSVAPGSFSDLYTFLFPASATTASGSAVTIDVGSTLNINNIQVSLLDAGSNILATGTVGESSILFDQPLTTGLMYSFNVTGLSLGVAGGAYAFVASASPVPEPEAYALLLAGLGVVGFIARRRKPS